MKSIVTMAGAALALAACTAAEPDRPPISDITVETDLSAIQSREASTYWQSLSDDLETALATELAGQIDPAGNALVVDIDELALTETYLSNASLEDARLSGVATLVTPGDGRPDAAFNVTATANDVVPYLAQGAAADTLSSTSREYYDAVVRAFAAGTAEALNSGT